jgi:hypothetical protein
MVFKYCTYHVCQLLYYSMVCTRYIHGTDMSVHVHARWSGFQMIRVRVWNHPVHPARPAGRAWYYTSMAVQVYLYASEPCTTAVYLRLPP